MTAGPIRGVATPFVVEPDLLRCGSGEYGALSGIGGVAANGCPDSSVNRPDPPVLGLNTGGCGGGRRGTNAFGLVTIVVGGFGAERFGMRLPMSGAAPAAGAVRGIGGGARGFSKLPS